MDLIKVGTINDSVSIFCIPSKETECFQNIEFGLYHALSLCLIVADSRQYLAIMRKVTFKVGRCLVLRIQEYY